MYCFSVHRNNGFTGTFQSLYCANLNAPLQRLDQRLRFLKVIKQLSLLTKMAGDAGMREFFIEIENVITANGVDEIKNIAKPYQQDV